VCFFVCLSVPKKDPKLLEILSQSFEVAEVTDLAIGKATCGNGERDRSFLVTVGGCSCFILGVNHGKGASKVETFESVIKVLLQRAPSVSILIHDTRGDIARESVICKYKSRISLIDLVGQVHLLQLDVRYVVTN